MMGARCGYPRWSMNDEYRRKTWQLSDQLRIVPTNLDSQDLDLGAPNKPLPCTAIKNDEPVHQHVSRGRPPALHR
jgi:hypothetical protein